MRYQDVIKFWFTEIEAKYWFKKDADFDKLIRERFIEHYTAATQCELYYWRDSAEGCLAEIILLDQFSRNLFRDSANAFKQDALALCLAQSAIKNQLDKQLSAIQRSFLYMPFMHSESIAMHDIAVELFSLPGLEGNLDFEHKHRNIIVEYGRYPHRNEVLGRVSSKKELEFLNQPGSSF